jgi:outer membrane protein OmpA-like peptidoglycan-associated protein
VWLLVAASAWISPGRVRAVEDIIVQTPAVASRVTVEPADDPRQVVVSVSDLQGNAVRGLQARDFVMGRGIRRARVLAASPLQASQPVPVNLVMVIDNSFSMAERQAVRPLLAALRELLKDIRPIDNIHAVVFSDSATHTVGGRRLNVRTFRSDSPAGWSTFFAEAFDRGITTRTYLYEGILAGLDIVRKMPADAHKLMVVFSDGEDLNSRVGRGEVEAGAFGVEKFQAFAIDYMPREAPDDFLESFAGDHHGRIWKARSSAELVPIFREFKSTILHKYVLTYELLNPIRLEPKTLSFELLTTTAGRPANRMVFFYTGKSDLPETYVAYNSRAEADAFQPDGLRGSLSRYVNILNFAGKTLREHPGARLTLVGCNSGTGVEADNLELSQRRAETVKAYLESIWGVDPDRMLVEARNLPAEASLSETLLGRLENQRVELVFDPPAVQAKAAGSLIAETEHRNALTVSLDPFPLPGITAAEIAIQDYDRPLTKVEAGAGSALPTSLSIDLDGLGRERLARISSIDALIRVTDEKNHVHEAASDLCHIKLTQREVIHELAHPPHGTVRLQPEEVTVEEITIKESAPLLNFVYFDTGRHEIPDRYALLQSPGEAAGFDEQALRGPLEKYRHVLNIIGRRTADRPKARLRIVGCNSGHGEEKGKTELSRARAESVRSYLRSVWGIDLARMALEIRGLPTAASSGSLPEGRAENQRVEIYADDPGILDTVQSTYTEALSDTERLSIAPHIEAVSNLKHWSIEIYGDDKRLEALEGEGELQPSYILALKDVGLLSIGGYQTITAAVEALDERGRSFRAQDSSPVRLIKREERLARREGFRILERYALILFDFDRAEIKDRNKAVMDRICARIREVPSATVKIVGHTDTIGSFDYNVALSKKRAEAAYQLILAGGVPDRERVTFEGRGPADALFDNGLPEGRAFNRTVTVILEYEQRH